MFYNKEKKTIVYKTNAVGTKKIEAGSEADYLKKSVRANVTRDIILC